MVTVIKSLKYVMINLKYMYVRGGVVFIIYPFVGLFVHMPVQLLLTFTSKFCILPLFDHSYFCSYNQILLSLLVNHS